MGEPEVVIPSKAVDQDAKADVAQIDRVSDDHDVEQSKTVRPDRVDRELAQYVSTTRIEISPERNAELRRMIDKRVLVIMVTTYFLQAIDKGTLSFASIMGIVKDIGIANPDGSPSNKVRIGTDELEHTCSLSSNTADSSVPMAYYLYLHCYSDCRVSAKLHHLQGSHCKIPELQHLGLGNRAGVPCSV